jgi:hypothetical protein
VLSEFGELISVEKHIFAFYAVEKLKQTHPHWINISTILAGADTDVNRQFVPNFF